MAMNIVDDDTHSDLPFQIAEKPDQLFIREVMKKQRSDDDVKPMPLKLRGKDIERFIVNPARRRCVVIGIFDDVGIGIKAAEHCIGFALLQEASDAAKHVATAAAEIRNVKIAVVIRITQE